MILYGSEISAKVKEQLKEKVKEIKSQNKRIPCLTVILVGDNPASKRYVLSKGNACEEIGIEHRTIVLDGSIGQEGLLEVVRQENENPEVDGILVQLPLPSGYDEQEVIHAISPDKDVDGLHPFNAGSLLTGIDGFVPCTPLGCMRILEEAGIKDLSGKRAVVVGRSNLVGKPVSLLLQKANATVTMAHSRTANLKEVCQEADVLVVAVGKAEMITKEYVKPGAIVIDVGINVVDGKLKGDVAFDQVEPIAQAITPVPKGVGPMTVCMLLANTIKAYELHEKEV